MRKLMLLITSILLVLTTSIAFSALSTSLAITSEVKFRFIDDIRINSVSLVSASNGAQIGYESEYTKNTVSNGFTLPNSESSIAYRVHIDNSGDTDYSIYEILRQSSDNGLIVSVSGYNVQDVIPKKTSLDLILTYTTSNPSESVINVVNTMDFKKVYYVTYETGTAQTIAAQVKYEGVNLTLSSTQPTKTGYTFQRWNTESDGTGTNYSAGGTYTLDESVKLYARYTANTYTINYTMNSGPDPLVKPTSGTYDEDVVISNPSDKTFTVNIDKNNTGAEVVTTASVSQVFTGWTNSTLGSNAKRGTTASPSTTWDGTSTTDTYFKNLVDSGTTTMVANWSAANLTLPTITKPGYTCKYNTESQGTGTDYAISESYPTSTTTSSSTLYVICTVNTYTVTYNTTENGGTGTIPEDYVPYGEPVDLTPTATKTGWTFVGWNTDKDATSALSSLTMGIDDITLYAIYRKEAVPLTASWHGNGATLSSSDPSTCNIPAVYNKAVQGTSCEVTAPTVTRLGYDFIGFNQSSGATTNDSNYNTSTKKLAVTTSTTGSTWYAITKSANPLTATFAANNGATVSPSSATCYLYNEQESCVVDGPTVTPQNGFEYIGFSMNQNATTNSSSYNKKTNKLTITGDSTWYPITRSLSQYTGTFTIQDENAATKSGGTPSCYRYNGGTECNIVTPTLTANSGYTIPLTGPWNTTANGSGTKYDNGDTISINGNKTYYSQTYYNTEVTITFNRNVTNAHTVSLTPQGGTASTETTLSLSCNKYNGATTCNITSPSIEAVTGYHAVGYGTSASATTSSWNISTSKLVSSDATYYAITAGNTYTIAFNANCPAGITATGSMSNLSMTYGTAKNLTANAFGCAGRVFDGWTINADGTGTTFDDGESVSNLTTTNGAMVNLYGKWRLNPPSPTISGGTTKIYGTSTTTLTCTENTTYPSGVTKYYSFGYATQENGSPSGWSDVSTSNTRTISSDAYVGERWYSCRVYVSDGTEISDTELSSNTTKMTLKNAKITFNKGSCTTITGDNSLYVNNSMTGVYTGALNTTAGSIPTASKSGTTFTGWYAQPANQRSGIPSGYTQIEYIESTGWQWIDTGYKHNQNTRMQADIYFNPGGAWKSPFGSWGAPSSSTRKMFGAEYNGTTTLSFLYGNFSSYNITDKSVWVGRHTWDFNKNTFSIDSTSTTFTAQTFTSDYNDYIFANSGYTGVAYGMDSQKVYWFKIWDNDTLVRDYVPVINNSTGIAGLYDLVNNTFYGSDGNRDFVIGNSPKVISLDGTIQSNVSNWTDSSSKWTLIEDRELIASCNKNYTLTLNNGNLLSGLDDIATTTSTYINYSISNGVVTATATRDDGYGFVTGRVYLEAGKSYTFNSSTNGTWGTTAGSDTVEAFLMLNGGYNTYYQMASNNNYQFTPTVTGTYYLRLDVNKNGETHTFSNISIIETNTSSNTTKTMIFDYPNNDDIGVPIRAGYTFNGWYTAPVGGKQIYGSNGKNVNAPGYWSDVYSAGVWKYDDNLTLYAQWTPITYTLRLNGNGGTIPTTTGYTIGTNGDSYSYASKTVKYGSIYGTLPTPTRSGYTFSGWYNARTYGNLTIAANSSNYNYKEIDYSIQPGVTYTITMDNASVTSGSASQFTILLYDFTSNSQVGNVITAFGANRTINVTCSESADPTHKLRMIIYSGLSGSTANIATSYTNIKIGTTGTTAATQYSAAMPVATAKNHQLYAIWSANTYYVTYDANGGTGAPAQQSFVYNSGAHISSTKPTRTGYTFTNWKYGSTTFNPGDAIPTGWGNFTLQAQWTAITYTVKYNGNGNTGGSTANSSHTYNVAKNLTSNGFTRSNCTFNGWNTNSSGTGTNYSNGQSVTNLSATNGATVNLYAKWSGSSYVVTYNANGGSIPATSGYTVAANGDGHYYAYKTIPYCGTYGTQPTPTRSGYTFQGWYSIYEGSNISLSATDYYDDWNGTALMYNVQPGNTYTVNIANATRTSGSATVFTLKVWDYSANVEYAAVNVAFGSNKTATLTVPSNAPRNNRLRIVIYCGEAGYTHYNSVTYTGIKVGTFGNVTSTKYTSTSNVGTNRNHVLVAKWTKN